MKVRWLATGAALALAGTGCGRSAALDLTDPTPPPPPPVVTTLAEPAVLAPDLAAQGELDLAACIDLAVRFNRAQQRGRLNVERRRLARLAARRSVFDPKLTASYTVQEGDDVGSSRLAVPMDTLGFSVEPFVETDLARDEDAGDDTWDSTYGVVVSRSVFRFSEHLRQRLPLTRATRDHHVAVYNRIRELRELRLAVTRAYLRQQRIRQRVAIRQARVADAEQFLADIEARVPKTAAPIEATNARIDLNRARSDLIGEETALEDAQEDLLDLLGADLDQQLQLADEDVASWAPPAIDLAADLTRIVVEHERVRIFELDQRIAEVEARIARDALIPDLQARVTVQETLTGDGPFADDVERDGRFSLGLRLTLPLDGHLAERTAWQQAKLELRDRELQLVDLRRGLEKNLRDQYRRLQALDRTVALAAELASAEDEKLQSSLQRYQDGTLDNIEVTRAKSAAEQAKLNLLSARIDRFLAVADYQAALPAVIGGPATDGED